MRSQPELRSCAARGLWDGCAHHRNVSSVPLGTSLPGLDYSRKLIDSLSGAAPPALRLSIMDGLTQGQRPRSTPLALRRILNPSPLLPQSKPFFLRPRWRPTAPPY